MGEFHALITLDSGEIRRAIIPEAIALPEDIANSYLLATTPFLIAGHRYIIETSPRTVRVSTSRLWRQTPDTVQDKGLVSTLAQFTNYWLG